MSVSRNFGRYVLESRLGEGASGIVFRAHDPNLGRTVALKILRADGEPASRARLLREARAAARVVHPNVVNVLDVGEFDGAPYVAMELVSGRSLRARIAANDSTIDERIRWLCELADACAAIHGAGLVHRDLKPENVMIDEDGAVKALDFGTATATLVVDRGAATQTLSPAHRADDGAGTAASTDAGLVLGTPAYMAPEQMRGEPLDSRVDQFAWGVIAYELLVGIRPWAASETIELVTKMLAEPAPVAPEGTEPRTRMLLDGVVVRTLAKDRRERFESMSVVATELRNTKARTVDPSSRARLLFIILIAAALSAVLVARGNVRRPSERVTDPVVAPRTDQSSASLGSSRSPNAQAMSMYLGGRQDAHDGSVDASSRAFDEATKLDPYFGAAHLRAALGNLGYGVGPGDGDYAHYRAAFANRSNLDGHDKVLLDAIEPWFRVPLSLDEVENRLAAATSDAPTDTDFLVQLCKFRGNIGRSELALETCKAVLALDPGHALALALAGAISYDLGALGAARAFYDQCTAIVPFASGCWRQRMKLNASEGRCAEAIVDARRVIALDPVNFKAYGSLANALAAHGDSRESILAALERYDTLLGEPYVKSLTESLFKTWAGDFDSADESLKSWERLLDSSLQIEHIRPLLRRTQIALEADRPDRVQEAAHDALARLSGWTTAIPDQSSIDLWLALRHSGAIDEVEWHKRRDEWLTANSPSPGESEKPPFYRWVYAEALGARTANEARHALERRPTRVDADALEPGMAEGVGSAYLLAGDTKTAIPYLRRAAQTCSALFYAVERMHANAELAQALAAEGDTKGACAADHVVTEAWGRARPRSRTAVSAAAHAHAIGCPQE